MAYSHDTSTPDGRVLQLKTWASPVFAVGGMADQFVHNPHPDLEGRSPESLARESLEGLLKAKDIMMNIKRKLTHG
ncbi:MAG: hypothetical protein J0L77_05650 [Alphaproteobacteria bacterium]|nr:hypothetical protein [Alphaproteobacteria bacterium]